jgi:hypothetical protein
MLCHFTPAPNIDGILKHGIVPRAQHAAMLGKDAQTVIVPDPERREGYLTASSISIMFPNDRLFYKQRQGRSRFDWAVLALDPSILWEQQCAFFPHNAAAQSFRGMPIEDFMGVKALAELFCDAKSPYPIEVQAEVLVFAPIPSSAIRAIEFEDRRALNQWAHRQPTPLPDHLHAVGRPNLFQRRPAVPL